MRPNIREAVFRRETYVPDRRGKELRVFSEGGAVLTRDYRGGNPKWVPGTIIKSDGPVSYIVKVGDAFWGRHVDQSIDTKVTATVENQLPNLNLW